MSLHAGDKLGPYEIHSLMAKGGMGEVYRARDTRLGRDVAVKVLPDAFLTEAASTRFQREARAASALSHPNICPIFDVGEVDGRPYLVMELLEGRTLRDYIGQQAVDTTTAIAFGAQIADALEAAHSRGIVHRDVKPGNIMVTGRHVKVLGFGLAKRAGVSDGDATLTLESLTVAGTVAGTPAYLAPELLQGAPADARSDIWALGIVLHEMLTGRRPFRGATTPEVCSAILHEAPEALPDTIPPGLRSVVDRCLTKRPGERYQMAGEVRAALEVLTPALSATRAQEAPPASVGAVSRRGWLWALGGAAGLAAGGFIWQSRFGATGDATGPPPGNPSSVLSTGEPASPVAAANQAFERFLVAVRADGNFERAQRMLNQALDLDPDFPAARRWRAFFRVFSVNQGYSNDRNAVYQSEEELRRLETDHPELASVHTAFAYVYLHQGRKDLVQRRLDLAVSNGLRDPQIQMIGVLRLYLNGQLGAAYEQAQASVQAVPVFTGASVMMGVIDTERGKVAAGIDALRQLTDSVPDSSAVQFYLAWTYLRAGDLMEAREAIRNGQAVAPGNYNLGLTSALLLAKEGGRDEALAAMNDDLLEFARANVFTTLLAAEFYATLGDSDQALDWLQVAVKNGDERSDWFRRDPLLASVRDETRFRQIVDSVDYALQQREE